MLVLNLLAGVIFGYLFWQHGLLAAIISPMLFQLVWFPVDKARMSRPGIPRAVTATAPE